MKKMNNYEAPVAEVIELKLTDEEKAKFDASVASMKENYRRALGM